MRFHFPAWTNRLVPLAVLAAGAVATYFGVVAYAATLPSTLSIGYAPDQPVPFSHKLHAGEMGLDCRYCHNTVERAAHAAIPPTQTCMNCHSQVKKDSPKLSAVRRSWEKDEPIPWVHVHQLPDYAFFDHRPHVAAGVGCASCHGRIDQMTVVQMDQPLSMSWCLDCHRNPSEHLRPLDQVTNMEWDPRVEPYEATEDPERTRQPNPPVHCSGCHR